MKRDAVHQEASFDIVVKNNQTIVDNQWYLYKGI